MATFVLVHGGGHGGWCYQRVAPLLRAAGHDVYTPTLTGLGERAHVLRADLDLDFHVGDIVNVLHFDDLRDVILVGHSYGGMVITGVADRATDRVGKLVYLDAATPKNGESLVDHAGPVINAVRPYGEVVDGIELVLLPGPQAGRLYGVEGGGRGGAGARGAGAGAGGGTAGAPAARSGAAAGHRGAPRPAATGARPRLSLVGLSRVPPGAGGARRVLTPALLHREPAPW